jgi:hypothetical protein
LWGPEDSQENSSIAPADRSIEARLDDPARRFVALVDEFYDQRVRFRSLRPPIGQLYRREGKLEFSASRLMEMQTERIWIRQRPGADDLRYPGEPSLVTQKNRKRRHWKSRVISSRLSRVSPTINQNPAGRNAGRNFQVAVKVDVLLKAG